MANQQQSDTKVKDILDFNEDIAVGVKFYTGPMDIKKMKSGDFMDSLGFKFKLPADIDPDELEDDTGIFSGANEMTCKFFDDKEGIMYVHFDRPVRSRDLYMFEKEELIYKKND